MSETLHGWLAEVTGRYPDRVAAADPDDRITYADLDRQAGQLARALCARGVGPGSFVAVLAERSVRTIVAFVGILKAGAAYVPLDPENPPMRHREIVDDSHSEVVVCDRASRPVAETLGAQVLDLDGPVDDAPATVDPVPEGGAADVAYVIYTSGSTGTPKGVLVSHANAVSLFRSTQPVFGFAPDDVWSVFDSFAFDFSVWEMWGPMLSGARAEVVPFATSRSAADTVDLLVSRGVTVLNLTPSAFGALAPGIWGSPQRPPLRHVIFGGERLDFQALRPWFDRVGDQLPICTNMFGITEATVHVTHRRVTRADADGEARSLIGRPLPGMELELRDSALRPVPDGQVGEIVVGGSGVALGYMNQERSPVGPFVNDDGRRMYRSGDLGRRWPDGDVEYLGRSDQQVKVRGFRVDPHEIEQVILAHPAVSEVAVRGVERLGETALLAYWVPSGQLVETEELYRHAADRLPSHMVPHSFVPIDRMPLTPNGKLDVRSLAALPYQLRGREEPTTESEHHLAALWADALMIEAGTIGRRDNFLALGGRSLDAAEVLRDLRATGVEISFREFFRAATLAELAELLDERIAAGDAPAPTVAVPSGKPDGFETGLVPHPVHRRRAVPATSAQEQAFLASRMTDDALPYQFQAVLHFRGDLDVAALSSALTRIVARHEIYRTRFVPSGRSRWRQIVEAPFGANLGTVDLRDRTDPEAALRQLVQDSITTPIDEQHLPLVRWRLARLDDHHHALVHVEHHATHDGWSWTRFLAELVDGYRAAVDATLDGAGGAPQPAPVQFRDFAEWQEAFEGSAESRRQLAYWLTRLHDLPAPLDLPHDRQRPARQTFRGDNLELELPPRLVERVEEYARENSATPYMVMLAAFAITLARYSGREDFVLGSGFANRRLPGCQDVIGMLVNTVALRMDLGGEPTVAELLERIRATALEAQSNQEVPFERVVQALDPPREPGATPVYRVLFSFHDSQYPVLELPGVALEVEDTLGNGSAKTDVNVIVFYRRTATPAPTTSVVVSWNYSVDLFDRSTSQRILAAFRSVLSSLVEAEADTHVAAIEAVSPEERHSIVALAGSVAPYERDASIAEIFEARVAESPDAVALVADGREWTYGELNRRANRIARRLQSLGLYPSEPVGILLQRSPEAVVAMLAVLKAGGYYVPLDPSLPAERLSHLLDDSGVKLVCTTKLLAERVEHDVKVVRLDDSGLDLEPGDDLAAVVTATDPAYLAYTSGTTGRQKGVLVPHRAVLRLVRSADYVALGPGETVLSHSPLSFDASTFEIWGPLLNGGSIALAPPQPLSPHEIAALLDRFEVTTLWMTAGLFHRFVDHCPEALGRLSHLLAGGDVLSPPHVARALKVLPEGAVLVNGYGPTESTTFACRHVMHAGSRGPDPVPIGRPVPNTTVYVLDERQRLVPLGVPGELYIGGDGVAIGYHGAGDLTAERFVPDPFGAVPGSRLYRTGDRALMRADGTVHFLGRLDRQVKVRGFRIEPEGIERVLAGHPGVREVGVACADDGPDGVRLVATIVAEHTGAVSSDQLRRFASLHLAQYEVPSTFVFAEHLPLTPTGKLDRESLTLLAPRRPRSAQVRSMSDLERTMLSIWEQVLGVSPIGPAEDFFELGGHSLLAVELFSRIEKVIGPRLPLASIFEAPTVEQLAEVARCEGWGAPWNSLVAINPLGSRPPLFSIAAGDGNTVGYGALSRNLGPDQPFYALQPRGLDGHARLLSSVESLAEHYLRAIRTVRPEGPYMLAGRCLGGIVAFEMARLLQSQGQEVALLAVYDSLGPYWAPRELADGIPFDEMSNLALRRAAAAGLGFDLADPSDVSRFLGWLREPAGDGVPEAVNRYLYEAYAARPDVRGAYPLDAPGQAVRLIDWAWINGVSEMGMSERLLPARSADLSHRRPSDRSGAREALRRATERSLDLIDVATRGRLEPLARRRPQRLQSISVEAVMRYRAQPYPGRITLIRSEEFRDNFEIARWHGVLSGEVEERYIRGSHRSMLREPDVAHLAAAMTDCVDEAIARGAT